MSPERPPELESEEEEQSESKGNDGDLGDSSDSDGEDGEETNDRCGIKWASQWEGVRLRKPLGVTESAMRAGARRMDPAEKERLLRTHEEIRLMKAKALAARRRLEADIMEVVMYEPDRRMGG